MTDSSAVDALISLLNNPPIISAVISAIVAFAILGIDKFILSPKARKKSYELRELEKRISAYGHLVALLKGARQKGEAMREKSEPIRAAGYTHLIEHHDIRTLDDLFGEKARLFSDKLLGLWFALLRKDKHALLDAIREKRTIGDHVPRVMAENLVEMQEIVESEYNELIEGEVFGFPALCEYSFSSDLWRLTALSVFHTLVTYFPSRLEI